MLEQTLDFNFDFDALNQKEQEQQQQQEQSLPVLSPPASPEATPALLNQQQHITFQSQYQLPYSPSPSPSVSPLPTPASMQQVLPAYYNTVSLHDMDPYNLNFAASSYPAQVSVGDLAAYLLNDIELQQQQQQQYMFVPQQQQAYAYAYPTHQYYYTTTPYMPVQQPVVIPSTTPTTTSTPASAPKTKRTTIRKTTVAARTKKPYSHPSTSTSVEPSSPFLPQTNLQTPCSSSAPTTTTTTKPSSTKRRPEHKRGQGMNLRMYLKPYLSPEKFANVQLPPNSTSQPNSTQIDSFPAALEYLLDSLIASQTAVSDPSTKKHIFTEEALRLAKERMSVSSASVVPSETSTKGGDRWRVWMPPALNRKFKIVKGYCAPMGTTVPVFVEMLLGMVGRRGNEQLKKRGNARDMRKVSKVVSGGGDFCFETEVDMSMFREVDVDEDRTLEEQLDGLNASHGAAGQHDDDEEELMKDEDGEESTFTSLLNSPLGQEKGQILEHVKEASGEELLKALEAEMDVDFRSLLDSVQLF
jgi:hypothetical protein